MTLLYALAVLAVFAALWRWLDRIDRELDE